MPRRIDQRLRCKVPLVIHGLGSKQTQIPGQLYDVNPTHFRGEFLNPLSTSKRYQFILTLPNQENQITGTAVVERTVPQENPALFSYVFAIETMRLTEQEKLVECIAREFHSEDDRRRIDSSSITVRRRKRDRPSVKFNGPRVVITGIGIVSPNALGREAYWRAIKDHRSGIGLLNVFDHTPFPIKIAGQVNDAELEGIIPKRKASRMGRATLLGWLAARLAIEDSQINMPSIDKDRIGVAMGTTLGALDWAFKQYSAHQQSGYQSQHPYTIAAGSCNAVSGEIAVDFQLRGPSITFSQGCSSSSVAISYGLDLIRMGRADAMLVGGTDAPLNAAVFGAFVRSGVLAQTVPWIGNGVITEDDCTGCVLSEGACVLLVESLEHAIARKAPIYAEILSAGMSSEGYHMLFPHPSGRGMVMAIREAMREADIGRDQIDLIMAHIAGMREGYDVEMKLLRREFNSHFEDMTVTNVKPLIGYTQGACGAFEAAAACLAFREPVDWISYGKHRVRRIAETTMVNCIGFGGKNVCLILRRP